MADIFIVLSGACLYSVIGRNKHRFDMDQIDAKMAIKTSSLAQLKKLKRQKQRHYRVAKTLIF
jgi:hypothetical protein